MRARHLLSPGPALAFVLLAAAACTTPDKAGLEEYAPKSPEAAIEAVSLSASDNDNFDPDRVGTEFPDTTEQVAVWYRWDNANSGTKVGILWSKDGQVVLEQGDTLVKVSGASAFILKLAAGSKLPSGNYQVELLEAGVAVTAIPFKVGAGSGERSESEPTAAAKGDATAPVASAEADSAAPPEAASEEPSPAEVRPAEEPPVPAAVAEPESTSAQVAARETKWPGIVAEITEFARKGNTLTAKLRFTNKGSKKVRPDFYYTDTYVLDADNKKYEVLKDDKGNYLGSLGTGYNNWWGEYIDPGASQTVWMRFPAPPAGVNVMTLQLPGIEPFEDVHVQN